MNRRILSMLVVILLTSSASDLVVAQHADDSGQRPGAAVRRTQPRISTPTDIFAAASSGDLERVKYFLDQGMDVNAVHPDSGETALIAALAKDKVDVAVYLLDAGADVKPVDRLKKTALQMAAHWGRTDLVERIIDLGADMHVTSAEGRSALHYATRRGYLDTMKVLIEHGADVQLVSGFGFAPIDLALTLGAPDAAEILVESGAKLTTDPARGVTRIATAAQKNWSSIVYKGLDEAGSDAELHQQLLDAAYDAALGPNHQELLNELEARGAGISDRTGVGVTRLFQASAIGNVTLVNRLLAEGMDPNESMGPSKWNALHAAVLGGRPEIVTMLLAAGANVDAADGLGRTPLHIAAVRGDAELVRSLLDRNANVNASDAFGDTPLHYAAHHGHKGVVEVLLAADASVERLNDSNLAPTDVAQAQGNMELVPLLALPAKPDRPVPAGLDNLARAAAAYKDPDSVALKRKELLQAVVDGVPPIHLAIRVGALNVVEEVLASDPDAVEARDPYGYLPLHVAAETGDAGILLLCVNDRVDVDDAGNLAGWTPLHFAASSGRLEIVRLLLDKGASPAAQDALGRTPEEVAMFGGHAELGQILK